MFGLVMLNYYNKKISNTIKNLCCNLSFRSHIRKRKLFAKAISLKGGEIMNRLINSLINSLSKLFGEEGLKAVSGAIVCLFDLFGFCFVFIFGKKLR